MRTLACLMALALLAVPTASANHEVGHLEGGCDSADGPTLLVLCVARLVLIHAIIQGSTIACAETGLLCPSG